MSDMTDESTAGASVWERELFGHLTHHLEAERDLLEQYSALVETTQSKALRYLVNLLIEDEMRHHRIFAELTKSLAATALLTGDPPVPYLDFQRADADTVRAVTGDLLEHERHDARECKRLRRELRDLKDTTLWDLLVDLMERDTEKHIAILRFVDDHS
jgi:bacterioferritin (cytochrome b1)